MTKVRMRITITGEYDAEVDEGAYGTTDPAGMAKVDEETLQSTYELGLILDDAEDLSIQVQVVSTS